MNKMEMAREETRAEAKQKWDSNAALRAEFSLNFDRYLAYLAANSSGNVRILKDQPGLHREKRRL